MVYGVFFYPLIDMATQPLLQSSNGLPTDKLTQAKAWHFHIGSSEKTKASQTPMDLSWLFMNYLPH